jgi:hypothetical protein
LKEIPTKKSTNLWTNLRLSSIPLPVISRKSSILSKKMSKMSNQRLVSQRRSLRTTRKVEGNLHPRVKDNRRLH